MAYLTTTQVADYLNEKHGTIRIKTHHIGNIFREGVLPESERMRHFRLIDDEQLPDIEQALVKKGLLPRPMREATSE